MLLRLEVDRLQREGQPLFLQRDVNPHGVGAEEVAVDVENELVFHGHSFLISDKPQRRHSGQAKLDPESRTAANNLWIQGSALAGGSK
ncbi:MAG: hypothetical protein M5R42_01790 [Rhodocyclaceae bacterium]|nr:hypothetical protein [Rhodocyclaceae bacterium]